MEDLKCQQNDLLQAGKQDTQLCTFQRSRAVLCFNDVVFINADHQTSRNYNDVPFICKITFVASAVNEKAISSASRLVSIFRKLFRFCKSSL